MSIDKQQRMRVAKAWRNWLILFVPIFLAILVARVWLGFNLIILGLLGVVVAGLLYQRVINGRSWRSLLWGIHASEK